ncbi:hypothetical protein [Halorhabdus sp. CUG00001]|uniref:hypothetical protein n=1 Tax=Halorhabdus sp. CUG00001 TaxID=2600297 RepID=UPI00131EBA97|nr:hypothetical protein [Halorhabdus sp. CUG00001]
MTDDDAYSGVVGAIPYAFRSTDSRLCRWYIVVGGLVGGLITLVFTLAVLSLVGGTVRTAGGMLTSSRAFYVLVGLCLVGPLLAPMLLVARSHRHGNDDTHYDRALAGTGFLFVCSIYFGLVASMPPTFQLNGETVSRPPAEGLLGPIVEFFYAIPEPAWPVVPATAAAIMIVVHRLYR